jgi:hypothetical protein
MIFGGFTLPTAGCLVFAQTAERPANPNEQSKKMYGVLMVSQSRMQSATHVHCNWEESTCLEVSNRSWAVYTVFPSDMSLDARGQYDWASGAGRFVINCEDFMPRTSEKLYSQLNSAGNVAW